MLIMDGKKCLLEGTALNLGKKAGKFLISGQLGNP